MSYGDAFYAAAVEAADAWFDAHVDEQMDARLTELANEEHEARWRELLVDGTYDDWKDDRLAGDPQADVSPAAFEQWMIDDAVDRAEAAADR